MPSCCDPSYFMTSREWVRAAVVFTITPIVIFAWPDRRPAMIVGAFVASLIVFFAAGVVAWRLELYRLLELYPLQLANALPALFLFMFVLGWIGRGGATHRFGKAVWLLVIAGTIWLMYDGKVAVALVDQPRFFLNEVEIAFSPARVLMLRMTPSMAAVTWSAGSRRRSRSTGRMSRPS